MQILSTGWRSAQRQVKSSDNLTQSFLENIWGFDFSGVVVVVMVVLVVVVE
jgi:hypothetical protein